MKQRVSPAVVAVAIVVVLALAGFFIWKNIDGGVPNIPPGGVGNAGPYETGAIGGGAGAKPPQATKGSGAPAGIPGR